MKEPNKQLDELATSVIGAAIEVHRCLGPGFLESVYEEALCMELELRRIPYANQFPISVNYKGREVGTGRIDILVANCLIVELKTVDDLAPIHMAQVISYLKATKFELGLLMNFNVPMLKHGIKRIAFSS